MAIVSTFLKNSHCTSLLGDGIENVQLGSSTNSAVDHNVLAMLIPLRILRSSILLHRLRLRSSISVFVGTD